MVLNEIKLGDVFKEVDIRNSLKNITDIQGINKTKSFMPTVADVTDAGIEKYKLVNKGQFVFSGMQTGRDKCIRIAMYEQDKPIAISPAYTVFDVINPSVLPEFVMMWFLRPESDRLGWFYSDSSIRSNLDMDRFFDIRMPYLPLDIQQKYVNIYKAMVANLKAYEHGLEDLKLTCDGYIENLKKSAPIHKLGEYIELSEERNADNQYGLESVRGISIEKKFIPTKADMDGVNLSPYYVVKPDYYAYVSVTSRNGDKISLALNDSPGTYICSSSYIVFKCNKSLLNPRYLRIILGRAEFDRYARFNSWGSARETFDWSEMCNVEIPVPDISIQKSIADIFSVYNQRKKIAEKMREKIKSICPVLIQGAIKEAMQK